jgi:hypothetical protein
MNCLNSQSNIISECKCPSLALIGAGHLAECIHFNGDWLSVRKNPPLYKK